MPLLLAVLLLLSSAVPAHARTAPCRPGGPTCHVWTGKVTAVNDGDTIDVDLAGDGRRSPRRVRFTAVQATELRRYDPRHRSGQCHAVEATEWLERTLRRAGNRVRLSARDAGARATRGRLLRFVAIRSGGRWRDVGERLLAAGHATWMPSIDETAWNARYARAEQRAAALGVGLWDADHCGVGPQQGAQLQVFVRSDPVGADVQDVNGEWVKVRNLSAHPVALGGWSVRNARLRRFTIPAGTTVPGGGTLTLHVGRGANRPGVLFWGMAQPTFLNANGDGRNLGDAALLFDPRGDVRAYQLYPCVVACSDPRAGALEVEAHPHRPEAIRVRNVSTQPVDLFGLQLALEGSTYVFEEGPPVAPGGALTVEVAGDPGDDTATERHWGIDRYMLPDAGGAIRLQTLSLVTLACDAWGDGGCR